MMCLKVLTSESMLPNKLKNHTEALQLSMAGNPRNLRKPNHGTFSRKKINVDVLRSFYKVVYHVAQNKKPRMIVKEMVLLHAVKIVTCLAKMQLNSCSKCLC